MAKKVYLQGEEFVFSRIKGNKESTYREGDVNLTPANIGASTEGHTHDDRYYTESEINTKLNGKANTSHGNHVPATQTVDNATFLRNDNTWAKVTPANIGAQPAGSYASASHTHDDRYYTESEINTKLNGKANTSHTHGNGDITSLDASKITSGTIDLARLPQGALERLTVVADDTARFKLTSSNVQKGDTVKVTSSGKMYYVVDETKLSSEAGYEVYAAGTAASVPWSGVTGKPSTYTPNSHTHTKSQITDFPAIGNGTVTITQNGTTRGTFTMNQTGNTTIALTDTNTQYAKMTGATSSTAGKQGLVPVPVAGDQNKYLRGDGTWQAGVTYDVATQSKNGLLSSTDKKTIDNLSSTYLQLNGDTEQNVVSFTSGDSSTPDAIPPSTITSGETHKSLFNKISTAVKNVRWLLSKMGTTDISSLGDGTVTGALSTLNSNKIGVYADKLYDLQVGMVLTSPAVVYLVNDNVNAIGNISVLFNNFTFFLTSGGIGQNNTHFLPKGAKITSITNLNQVKYYYLTA